MTMLFSFQGCSDSEDVANTNAAPQLEFSSNVVSLAESQQELEKIFLIRRMFTRFFIMQAPILGITHGGNIVFLGIHINFIYGNRKSN